MKLIFLLALSLLISVNIFAKPLTKISYTVKPIFADNQLRLKITVSFTTDNSLQTKLEIPQLRLKNNLSQTEKKLVEDWFKNS